MSWSDPSFPPPIGTFTPELAGGGNPQPTIELRTSDVDCGSALRSVQNDERARPVARLAVAGILALALSGCFRPLYGPTASGVPLQDVLASIEVEKASSPLGQERLSHYVRSELIFGLDGSGSPREKRYKLSLDTAESIQPISVDTVTGRADAALLNGTVKFELKSREGKTVLAGTARANVTYQRDQQRFASVRAARDADMRVGQLIADDIKQRIAAYMATAP